MRSVPALLLAMFLLLGLAPTGSAQPGGLPLPPPIVLEDPAGDLEGPAPDQGAGFVDVVRAEVTPGLEELGLKVTVADLTADAASGFQLEFWLAFEYRGVPYHFAILGQTSAPLPDEVRTTLVGDPYAVLYRMDEDFPPRLHEAPAGLDVAGRTWNATLPWAAIEGGGYSPQPGEALRLVDVASLWDATLTSSPHQGAPLTTTGITAADVAAFPEGTFLPVPGAVGDLALTTPLPVRSSNGEATTFHWPVEVINRGGRELDVTFELEADGAEGRVPPGLRLPPAASAVVNVFVTVPFAHQHGTLREFPLTARAGPGDQATLRLGVDYPAVAQPAGHHPDLYVHGAERHLFGAAQLPVPYGAWMNTLEDDEASTAQRIQPDFDNCPLPPDMPLPPPLPPVPSLGDLGSSWTIPLGPALAMGLDARLGETSGLDLELEAIAAMPAGRLHGRLMLASETFDGFGPFYNQTDPARASVQVPSQPGPGSVALHLDLPTPASLDLVPPRRGENLVLGLIFCPDLPPPSGFGPGVATGFASILGQAPYALRPGAHLRLAVDEYHDIIPVDHAAQGLFLTVDEPVARAAPGATVVFRPRVSFPANGTGEHAVRLFGTGAAHADLLAGDVVQGPEELELPVAFVVPDAAAGEAFDLLLDVTHTQEPSRSVALRLTVVVDPASSRDDAAQLAGLTTAPKDAPAAPLGLAALALALLALRRRAQ